MSPKIQRDPTEQSPVGSGRRTYDPRDLRRIRDSVGLTQDQFAEFLGVNSMTYRDYEYGRTQTLPEGLKASMSRIITDPTTSYIIALYSDRPMHTIANEWAVRMGLPVDSPAALADALGINKSTTSRWLDPSNDVALSFQALKRYDERVVAAESIRKKSKTKRKTH